MGIFNLIDEICSYAAGTEDTLVQKIRKIFEKNKFFESPKFGKDNFIIHHSPREVEYHATGFIVKNKDLLNRLVVDVMASS